MQNHGRMFIISLYGKTFCMQQNSPLPTVIDLTGGVTCDTAVAFWHWGHLQCDLWRTEFATIHERDNQITYPNKSIEGVVAHIIMYSQNNFSKVNLALIQTTNSTMFPPTFEQYLPDRKLPIFSLLAFKLPTSVPAAPSFIRPKKFISELPPNSENVHEITSLQMPPPNILSALQDLIPSENRLEEQRGW